MCTSILFLKEERRSIKVESDGVVPLFRSHVAVPFDSYLFVDISLHVDGHKHTTSMTFPTLKEGDATGTNKFFKVKVSWDVLYDSTFVEDE